ncbi:MAG: PH domain-containing protein [Chloroflexia bacterium]
MRSAAQPKAAQAPAPPGRAKRQSQARRYARLIHDRRPDERVVFLLRRHPVVLVRTLAMPILLLAIWVVGFLIVEPFLRALSVDPLVADDAPPAWLVPSLWTAWFSVGGLLVGWFAYALFDWREDWIALTTQRVIVMDKALFLRESRREAPLGKVQNVVASYPNALGMAMDFGDIKVDTAGVGTLHFESLPQPKALREAIFRQQQAVQSVHPPTEDLRKSAVRAIVLGRMPGEEGGGMEDGGRRTVEGGPGSQGARRKSPALRLWHKHWIFLVRGLAVPVLIWGGVFVAWSLSVVLGEPGVAGPVENVLTWLLLLLLPVCAAWSIWAWEDWRNDLYKLDHERVYHIESLPFGLREQSKETLINRITDVMYVIPGPLANLLDYGSVVIKTPGEATEFVFAGIPHPRAVQQEIMQRVDDTRRKSAGPDHEIEAWIKAYHEVLQGN